MARRGDCRPRGRVSTMVGGNNRECLHEETFIYSFGNCMFETGNTLGITQAHPLPRHNFILQRPFCTISVIIIFLSRSSQLIINLVIKIEYRSVTRRVTWTQWITVIVISPFTKASSCWSFLDRPFNELLVISSTTFLWTIRGLAARSVMRRIAFY